MKPWNMLAATLCISLVPRLSIGMLQAQHDPGPRTDTAGAGGPLPTLNSDEQNLFLKALAHFKEINSVDGKVDGEESIGLGPTFNGNSCAMCHAAPAVGGTSPALNPQLALTTLHAATNTVPSSLSAIPPPSSAGALVGPAGVVGFLQFVRRSS